LSRLRRLWTSFLLEPLRRIDREQRDFLARPESHKPDWKVMAVLVTSAVVLILQQYFGGGPEVYYFPGLLEKYGLSDLGGEFADFLAASPANQEIARGLYWSLFSFATYFFIPWFVIAVLFRKSLTEFGIKLRGAFTDWWVYIVFFAVMWPLLFWVSTHKHFQNTYPFHRLQPGEPLWPYFWLWEASYFLQFIGLEFFFRGFMVHGTKHRFGIYSIFVMAVPYCMIHFQKPFLETCGALIAGIVLGYMSLKTRSIFLGAAIHMSVALSMDMLSLWRQGRFG
jgi:membrane protease YdiL (CAAX protease family)